MKTKTARILAIGAAFTAFVTAIVMVISLTTMEPMVVTKRFDTTFRVVTQDAIELNIRIFGSQRHEDSRSSGLLEFKHKIRGRFASIMYTELPAKLRPNFREELQKIEDHGTVIDSIYAYREDDDS